MPVAEIDDTAQLAFPTLAERELQQLERLATHQTYRDGEIVFQAGQAGVDLFVVRSGQVDILNPVDGNRLIVSHMPGDFAGDIDLLTRRPVIVTAVARGPHTELLRIPGAKIHDVLNSI